MKQLSSLALPLAVASVFIFLLFFVFNLNLFNVNTFVWSALAFLIFASYTAFFLFLHTSSPDRSPSRAPSLVIFAGVCVFLLTVFITILQNIMQKSADVNYGVIELLYSANTVFSFIGYYLAALGFFILAPSFKKGSIQEIASYVVSICLVADSSLYFISSIAGPQLYELIGLSFYRIQGILSSMLLYLPFAFFFYAYSLLGKEQKGAPGPMQMRY